MFQNYLKIAFRNLLKFKGYAAINIFGLAIGIACCLLIVQHLRDELSYDAHHVDKESLYRVGTSFITGDRETETVTGPSPLAWTLVDDYPEVEMAARLLPAPGVSQYLIKKEDRSYFEERGYYADSTFFRTLTYDFVEGDPQTALGEPLTVVLTKRLADKLFANKNALNQTIKIGDQWGENDFKVTGVVDDKKYRTHIDGNFYMNMRSGAVGQHFYALPEWAGNNLFHTYIKLAPGADPKSLEAKFPALVEEKAGERLRTLGFEKSHHLEAVSDIYLYEDAQFTVGPRGDISFVYIFSAIAAFILFLACINFMNLSTAKATVRAQEVGVRKVVGANRGMLAGQFFTEAFFYTLIAVVVAIIAAEISLPYFNQLSGKEIALNMTSDWTLIGWVMAIMAVTTLLAGSYPSLYLSSFNPAHIFKGKIGDRFSAKQVRRALVVVQFVVSIGLIQGILVIQQQMEFLRNKNLGFSPEAKLAVPLNTTTSATNFHLLKEAFLKNGNVKSIGGTSAAPGMPNIEDMLIYGEGQTRDEGSHTSRYWVDADFVAMMDFELLEGRTFEENRMADSAHAVVVNERLIKNMGYTLDDAVGKKIFWNWRGEEHTHEIIGVVKDFHPGSLRSEMDAYAFHWEKGRGVRQLVASVSTNDLPALIADLQKSWEKVNPSEPFDYFFLDDKLQMAYQTDRRTAGLIFTFTLLAILISCLGLLGLATFAAESRTKEIGVRKVLGATTASIVGLMSKEFLWLVILALVIATPIAWYFMNGWLQDFHYHIDMPWWAYGLAGILALVIAFLTVGVQSVKAAVANPVESLRAE